MLLHACAVFGSSCETAFAQGGTGSNFSTYVTGSTDLVRRGMSQTDGAAALQVGVDYQHKSGVFVGGWASNVAFATESSRSAPREIELDYYVGYGWSTAEWSFSAALSHYGFPGASVSYDYTEVSGRAELREIFSYTISYTDELLSQSSSAINHELGLTLELPWSMQLDASVGRFDSDDVRGGAYDHWNLGISRQAERLSVDLRFYDADYDFVSHLGSPLRENWVLSVTYAL